MAVTWLIDKSADTRIAVSPDVGTWMDRIERGLVRMGTVTRLEVGFSFRTGTQARIEATSPPLSLMPVEYLTPAAEDRAVEIQLLLTDRGQHRGPSVPDLLIAATAEMSRLTLLHVDKDFETIAELTGQKAERL